LTLTILSAGAALAQGVCADGFKRGDVSLVINGDNVTDENYYRRLSYLRIPFMSGMSG